MSPPADCTRHAAGALLRGEAIAGAHLRVAGGPDGGRRIALLDDQTLGRGRESDVRLEDPGVSRRHARLSRDRAGWVARDLGSKNGLRVNGRRCRRPRALRPGDELTIGATRLVLEPGLLEGLPAGDAEPERATSVAGAIARRRHAAPAALLAAASALAGLAAALLAFPS